MDRLTKCITQIHDWVASNRLQLNEEKTQIIWLSTRQQHDKYETLKLPNVGLRHDSIFRRTLLPETTPTIAIYYYYSARKLILILPSHRG